MSLMDKLTRARAKGTPLIAITTLDQFDLTRRIISHFNRASGTAPAEVQGGILVHDILSGVRTGMSDRASDQAFSEMTDNGSPPVLENGSDMLVAARKMPENTILVVFNAQWAMGEPAAQQGILSLRDAFKKNVRTFIMLGPPSMEIPELLANDVLMLEDPLPDEGAITAIVEKAIDSFNESENDSVVERPSMEEWPLIRDALRGLPPFPIEESCILCLDEKKKLDPSTLWERKEKIINRTKGITVRRKNPTFADIGGHEVFKAYWRLLMKGKAPPDGIIQIDEADKVFAGIGSGGNQTEGSGVVAKQQGHLLTWLEEKNVLGCLLIGSPGTGKSLLVKGIAGEFDRPLFIWDLPATMGKYVGESEAGVRRLTGTTEAMLENPIVICTCNRSMTLSPELRRRLQRNGTWFCAMPTLEEKRAIASIKIREYGLEAREHEDLLQLIEEGETLTGADIRNIVDLMWRLGIRAKEARMYIVPVAMSDPIPVADLENQAHGTFLSTHYPGVFMKNAEGRKPADKLFR